MPAIASLLVCFDPLAVSHTGVEAHLRGLPTARRRGDSRERRVVRVPVRYGGEDGPDLESAAWTLGLTPDDLVATHTAEPYRVMMIGFAPGFPYIGPLPAAVQEYVYMAAGVGTDAKSPEAARALLKYLGDPAVVLAMSAVGLEPPAAK